jgi:hypothetical protein
MLKVNEVNEDKKIIYELQIKFIVIAKRNWEAICTTYIMGELSKNIEIKK